MKRTPRICLIFWSFFLTACHGQHVQDVQMTNLDHLQEMRAPVSRAFKSQQISQIRLQALRETALSLGARGGLAWRGGQINTVLTKNEKMLDQIFNFNGMLLPNNVLPPVLVEARQTLNVASQNSLRLADRNYQILKQARFVSAAPTWRDYIWMNYSIPEKPHISLLPVSKAEHESWEGFIKEGWDTGVHQANMIFDDNLSRLKRDYSGMALYRKMLAQQVVSAPYVAKSNLGVTGGGDNLRVNDQILRITAMPQLSPEAQNWNAVIVNDRD